MRILVLDIETAPLLAHVWGLRDQNISIGQVAKPDRMLSFAAMFHGERKVHFHAEWIDGERAMVKAAHKLLDEADVVVTFNGIRFDIPWLQSQFLRFGLSKPSPYTSVDLYRSVRRQVRLPSYKLQYVAQWLGIGSKVDTGGFGLWLDVMAGKRSAQRLMKIYNIEDTKLTNELFTRLRSKGWVLGLPNAAIDGGHVCPACGGERLQARGFAHSKTRRYRRFQCSDCGSWSQSAVSEPGGAKIKAAAA